MYNPALEEWLNEAQGDPAMNPGGNPPAEGLGVPPGAGGVQAPDPNAPVMAADLSGGQVGQDAEKQSDQEIPDRSEDPQAPDMPEEKKKQSFEQWQDTFFRESVKADVNKLIDLIQQVRDLDLESYPRKFIEDNLQVLFLRQNANIDKASKEVRKQIKAQLDSNFPARSIVGYLFYLSNNK